MADDVLRNPRSGQTVTIISESPEVLVMESTYPAGSPSPPPHLHPKQTEHFTVLSGGVRAVVDGTTHELCEGDTLTIPAGAVHEFGGLEDQSGTVRWEVRPALRTAEFLRGMIPGPNVRGVAKLLRTYDDEFRLAQVPRGLQKIVFGLLGR
jgi:quercetin dioxygenase-like cupin family protein